jgi:hypothetical protein
VTFSFVPATYAVKQWKIDFVPEIKNGSMVPVLIFAGR